MDELLRRLERSAGRDDRAARHAHIRALERSGDRLGAWLARCRLAREDVADAQAAPSEHVTPLRTAPRVTASRELRERVELVATTQPHVVLQGHGVLDAGDLSTRWPIGARTSVECSGPRLVEATTSAVQVRDLRAGTLLGEAPLPPGERPYIQGLLVAGDRAIVEWRDMRPGGAWRLLLVDLGFDAGRLLADREHDSLWSLDGAVGGLVLFDDQRGGRSVTACDLDGAERWSVEGAYLAADARGAVLDDWNDQREEGPAGRSVREVDLEKGIVRWRAPDLGFGQTLLFDDAVIRVGPQTTGEGLRALAVGRIDGGVAWVRPLTELRAVLLGQHVVGGVGYFALGAPRDGASSRPRLLALDLATGALLFEREVATPPGWEGERWHRRVQLQPVDGGLVVVASTHLDARLERWSP